MLQRLRIHTRENILWILMDLYDRLGILRLIHLCIFFFLLARLNKCLKRDTSKEIVKGRERGVWWCVHIKMLLIQVDCKYSQNSQCSTHEHNFTCQIQRILILTKRIRRNVVITPRYLMQNSKTQQNVKQLTENKCFTPENWHSF